MSSAAIGAVSGSSTDKAGRCSAGQGENVPLNVRKLSPQYMIIILINGLESGGRIRGFRQHGSAGGISRLQDAAPLHLG